MGNNAIYTDILPVTGRFKPSWLSSVNLTVYFFLYHAANSIT